MGRKGTGLGVKLKEREELWPAKAVEGTNQCGKCQCYMSLGDARLCMIEPGDFRSVAEIVDWAPGKCASYVQKIVKCGKPGCKKCQAPGGGHGPYWYKIYRTAAGKVRTKYCGKVKAT